MKIGIVQQSNTTDIAANSAKSLKGIEECKAQGAELVVLQELHCGIYFCQAEETDMFNMAEPIPSDTTQLFSEAAKNNEVLRGFFSCSARYATITRFLAAETRIELGIAQGN